MISFFDAKGICNKDHDHGVLVPKHKLTGTFDISSATARSRSEKAGITPNLLKWYDYEAMTCVPIAMDPDEARRQCSRCMT